jgi:hypothetical protein
LTAFSQAFWGSGNSEIISTTDREGVERQGDNRKRTGRDRGLKRGGEANCTEIEKALE